MQRVSDSLATRRDALRPRHSTAQHSNSTAQQPFDGPRSDSGSFSFSHAVKRGGVPDAEQLRGHPARRCAVSQSMQHRKLTRWQSTRDPALLSERLLLFKSSEEADGESWGRTRPFSSSDFVRDFGLCGLVGGGVSSPTVTCFLCRKSLKSVVKLL